jgi:hypothetical protein
MLKSYGLPSNNLMSKILVFQRSFAGNPYANKYG